MIIYSATKARFRQDVMSNDNPDPAVQGRIPRSSGFRTKRYARRNSGTAASGVGGYADDQVRKGVCRPERAHAMRGVSFSRNLPAIGAIICDAYITATGHSLPDPDGAWQHEEIILKPLNPEYKDIVIPNAKDEEFMVVAEVVGKCVMAGTNI